MNKVYEVSNLEKSEINLWKTNEDQFRIIEYGLLTPILIGLDYTLIDKTYITVFEKLLSDEIEIKPVLITRKSTSEEWNNYYEIDIK
jgi:hypothetical protein